MRLPLPAKIGAAVACGLALFTMVSGPISAHDPDSVEGRETIRRFEADRQPAQRLQAITNAAVPCENGSAGNYPCNNVDLMSFLPLADIGGGNGNDIWGWTDPSNNREYAIMGRTSGTSFVDITDAANPRYLGNLPTATSNSSWRDIKVYNNHAFIVSEASSHGMQVFNLTRLRGVTSPQTFTADARYTGFGNAHNIAINEDSGFAYAIGTGTCSGGPHMVNIQNPTSPSNAGCVSGDGYTHDTQCVNYNGPDADYSGRELCFNSNEDTLTIVDVTNKSTPRQIARKTYSGSAYTHQGWLTEDHRYFLLDDELDEQRQGVNTKTYIFNLSNVDAPVHSGTYTASVAAIDHNQYVKGNYSYQANYRAGLRVLDISGVGNAQLTEAAYFDIYPSSNSASFNGAWSNYPYFASGNVIVSGIEQGLFVLRPNLGNNPPGDDFSMSVSPTSGSTDPGGSVTATVNTTTTSGSAQTVNLTASGLPSGATASFNPSSVTSGGSSTLTIATGASTPAGTYQVTITGAAASGNKTATYTLTVNGAGGSCSGTNGNDVAISDHATVNSPITISGCSGNASATATVDVNIQHTYIGDLVVSLVAPDGTAYTLHNRAGGSADNIVKTYTVDLSSEAANGTWNLRVQDAASQDTGKIDTWTLNLGGGTPPPPPDCGGTNGNDVAISDHTTVESPITVSGCTGNASATSTVAVTIQHTYIGDLIVTLVAPDGSTYTLHNRAGGSADNINKTYTVNLSAEARNGTWKLRVHDAASQDIGKIDTWTLTL
ncbi:MAG: choice-of-anchor B family protein [Micromonosporaceae bacterium]